MAVLLLCLFVLLDGVNNPGLPQLTCGEFTIISCGNGAPPAGV
jgi:hypothetical protein